MTNRRMSEVIATLPAIVGSAAATTNGAAFTLDKTRKAMFSVVAGPPATGGTVDFKLQASPDGSTGWADVTGAKIVQLTAAGIAQLEIAADRINAMGVGPFFRGVLTIGTAAVQTAVLGQLSDARYQPASLYNDASVATAVLI